MRVLVTGAGGMLARAVHPRLQSGAHSVFGLFADEEQRQTLAEGWDGAQVVTLGDEDGHAALRRVASSFRPEAIVHCAAWTDVDGCQFDPPRAFRSNAEACRQVADVAKAHGAWLAMLSTDYVFDGKGERPYVEEDPVGPPSIYGQMKLAGERFVRATWDRHAIVRTAWLYGSGGRNFVDTIRGRLAQGMGVQVVNDQRGNPTWTADLAEGIARLLEIGASGTFHVVNSGACTWFELACAIDALGGTNVGVKPISSATLDRPAPRPAYSVLDCTKFERTTGWRMPPWKDALQRYLDSAR